MALDKTQTANPREFDWERFSSRTSIDSFQNYLMRHPDAEISSEVRELIMSIPEVRLEFDGEELRLDEAGKGTDEKDQKAVQPERLSDEEIAQRLKELDELKEQVAVLQKRVESANTNNESKGDHTISTTQDETFERVPKSAPMQLVQTKGWIDHLKDWSTIFGGIGMFGLGCITLTMSVRKGHEEKAKRDTPDAVPAQNDKEVGDE